MDTITLTGYLGANPERRFTRARQEVQTRRETRRFVFEYGGRWTRDPHDGWDQTVEQEVDIQPREFAVLSLATHSWRGPQKRTQWHRLVAWNTCQLHFGIFRLGKGDRVRIVGRPTSFKTQDGRKIDQIEITDFHLLRRKLRFQDRWDV